MSFTISHKSSNRKQSEDDAYDSDGYNQKVIKVPKELKQLLKLKDKEKMSVVVSKIIKYKSEKGITDDLQSALFLKNKEYDMYDFDEVEDMVDSAAIKMSLSKKDSKYTFYDPHNVKLPTFSPKVHNDRLSSGVVSKKKILSLLPEDLTISDEAIVYIQETSKPLLSACDLGNPSTKENYQKTVNFIEANFVGMLKKGTLGEANRQIYGRYSVTDYLIVEILDVSSILTRERNKTEITVKDIQDKIKKDEELKITLSNIKRYN